jgi:hypothetical protein
MIIEGGIALQARFWQKILAEMWQKSALEISGGSG